MPHNPKKNGFRYTISQAGPQISYQNWLRQKYVYVYLRICMAGGGVAGGAGGEGVGDEKRAAQVERIAERT